jgi:uncharacterized protein (DUF302 family)
MEPKAHDGLVDLPSGYSVEQTVERLKTILEARGITLFALIDHSGEAAKVGLILRPTKLLIFGSPRAGTPLMIASTSIAIDLPLKFLVWKDAEGKTWISYNSAQYLRERHHLPMELSAPLAAVEAIAAQLG